MSEKYFSIGKTIKVKSFIRGSAPMGWYREDILKKKLKEDLKFRNKFSVKELKELEK